MYQYLQAVEHCLARGELSHNRTGVDTLSVFGYMMKFDLRYGFPAMTTKKLNFSAVVKELLWFLRGETNIDTLGCGIWNQWADNSGEVPYCYGQMWRRYPGRDREVDQIKELIERMEKDPDSRRHIICAWSPEFQDKAGLAWCHAFVQFKISGDYLDCCLTQRSCDLALGVPFNIASYALLMSMVAHRLGKEPRIFTHYLNDMHIYVNHVDGLKKQMGRSTKKLPTLKLNVEPYTELWDYKLEDIILENYEHEPAISFEVAV